MTIATTAISCKRSAKADHRNEKCLPKLVESDIVSDGQGKVAGSIEGVHAVIAFAAVFA